jgi:hypothetical protein
MNVCVNRWQNKFKKEVMLNAPQIQLQSSMNMLLTITLLRGKCTTLCKCVKVDIPPVRIWGLSNLGKVEPWGLTTLVVVTHTSVQ